MRYRLLPKVPEAAVTWAVLTTTGVAALVNPWVTGIPC